MENNLNLIAQQFKMSLIMPLKMQLVIYIA